MEMKEFNRDEKLFLSIEKYPDVITKGSGMFSSGEAWGYYCFPFSEGEMVFDKDKKTHIHTNESVLNFMKFKNRGRVSKDFVLKLNDLKPGESLKGFNLSLSSEVYFVRFSEELYDLVMSHDKLKKDLVDVEKKIEDSVPLELKEKKFFLENSLKDSEMRLKGLSF